MSASSPPPPPPPSPAPAPRSGRGAQNLALDPSSIELALITLQQRIDLMQANLAQQNKLATLGMVTAVIAHEFNNILTPMMSYTTFALGEKADEALRTKALTKALAGAQRMANISKSLLGFARGDESTRANVLAAVKETLACLSRELIKDGITLTLDVAEDLAVSMNAGQLQQVLMNLVVNARSAMLNGRAGSGGLATESGSGVVSGSFARRAAAEATRRAPGTVSTRDAALGVAAMPVTKSGGVKRLTIRALTEKGRVRIFVADTGPGIPADVLPRIFEPFFSTKGRGEARPKEGHSEADGEGIPKGGTGLGLTICHELVTAAGGSIAVESEVGKGTTFVIELGSA